VRLWLCFSLALLGGSVASGAERPIVAIFDLETRGIALGRARLLALSDYLSDSLAASAYRVVPRDQLRRRLAAQRRRSYRPCHDRSCQVEIGRELAAQKSLSTRLLKIGRRCVATATLYDLGRATTERGATAEGGCSDDALRELLKRLVHQLAGAPPPQHPRGQDDAPMVTVPAGPTPPRRGRLDAFAIDRHEVTVAQYRRCVQAGACREPGGSPACNWTRADRSRHPVNCVDWNQARAYCAWAGKRLPSEAEWEKAARGARARAYPWGDAPPDCARAAMSGCTRHTAPVGSRSPRGDSPYGLWDMAGNVWEWVSDSHGSGPQGRARVCRGGSWQDDADELRATSRDHAAPTYRHVDLGFRCARSH
jgi:formylglycine-generating enzyme required for sulfatase activity